MKLPREYYMEGGRPRKPEYILSLISELEGSYQQLKYMGFYEDAEIINEMKRPYYKLYFSLIKNK